MSGWKEAAGATGLGGQHTKWSTASVAWLPRPPTATTLTVHALCPPLPGSEATKTPRRPALDPGDGRPAVDADGQPDALERLEPLAAHTKRIERHQLHRRRGGRLRSDAERGSRANGGDHGDEDSQPMHTDSMRAIRRLET